MDPAFGDSVTAFCRYLAAERAYSAATIIGYRRDLEELVRLTGAASPETLDTQAIRTAAARLRQRGLSARSIARALSAWRSYFAWGCRVCGLTHNPVTGVRAPKAPRGLPKALSTDQAKQLLDAPTDAAPDDALRDNAMFELFYSSGLRLSELIGLDAVRAPDSRGWVDTGAGELTVTGKGGKTRIVPVGAAAQKALAAWLAGRGAVAKPGEAALFVSPRGRRVSASYVSTRLKRRTLEAGVPAKVHPHVLRHSFASHLLQSSGDLRAVQELLGHANISTTQVYTHLDFQQLARVYDAAHPRARRK